MLSIFSTPKPFLGHTKVIQRNAIRSWTRLWPEVEVMLFGDEAGTAEAARDLGATHIPRVERNEHGTKLLNDFFGRAQGMARHKLVCYVNCDIILLNDFRMAVEAVSRQQSDFLAIGRRWNTEITEPLDFDSPEHDQSLRNLVLERGKEQSSWCIDYFVFRRGFYSDIPPLVIGRIWWDNWLVWRARAAKADVIDISAVVRAVHQNHDYAYHPAGHKGVSDDEQAQSNFQLAGGWPHLFNIDDATELLTPAGLRPNRFYRFAPTFRTARRIQGALVRGILGASRPLRQRTGINKEAVEKMGKRLRRIASRAR